MKREAMQFDQILDSDMKTQLPKVSLTATLRGQFEDVTKTNSALIRIKDLLCMYGKGEIVGYNQNRGSGKASKSTVNAVRDKYNPDALGCLMIGMFPNGFVAGEGHGRGGGICERSNLGNFTDAELQDTVAIRMVSPEKFLETYQDYNNQQKHTVNNCLANQDLAFGNKVDHILCDLEVEAPGILKEMDKGKNYPILSDIIWALHKENTEATQFASFKDVYALRRDVSKLANKQGGTLEIRLSKVQEERLKNGLIYWYKYISDLKNMEKTYKVKVVKTYRGKGWMGAVICDRIFNHKSPVFHKAPSNLAKASYAHAVDVRTYIPELTRVKGSDVNQLIRTIDDILRGRRVANR